MKGCRSAVVKGNFHQGVARGGSSNSPARRHNCITFFVLVRADSGAMVFCHWQLYLAELYLAEWGQSGATIVLSRNASEMAESAIGSCTWQTCTQQNLGKVGQQLSLAEMPPKWQNLPLAVIRTRIVLSRIGTKWVNNCT